MRLSSCEVKKMIQQNYPKIVSSKECEGSDIWKVSQKSNEILYGVERMFKSGGYRMLSRI